MANPPNRFVILHHLAPTGEHWDLMLEHGDVLLTWQLQAEPVSRDACPVAATRIKDHRKFYLEYEGPVSGGRGVVSRVDQGRYRLLSATEDALTVELQGRRLHGDFRLVRSEPLAETSWVLEVA